MTKFIQVNKMYLDLSAEKYFLSEADTLLNVDHILELSPRSTDEKTNRKFVDVSACHVYMSNGDRFYIHGSFDNIKEKIFK